MPLGDYSLAKIDYLRAGLRENPMTGERFGVTVNRRGCRLMHPYGARMVRDGFFTTGRARSFSDRCTYTVLHITPEGEAELARLEKRLAKKAKRHAQSPYKLPRNPRPKFVKPGNQTRAIASRAAANAERRVMGKPLLS